MNRTYIEHGTGVKIPPTAHPAIITAVDASAGTSRATWAGQHTVVADGIAYTGQAKPAGSGTITFVVHSKAPAVKAAAPAKAAAPKPAPKKAAAPAKAAAPKAAPKKAGKK
jgi:histone H1/5